MTTKPLSERLRDNPTSDIMTEAADRLDAQGEDYRDLYAEKVALEQIVAAQADSIRALLAERDALKEALEMLAGIRPCPDMLMGNVDIARAALAQEQGGSDGDH